MHRDNNGGSGGGDEEEEDGDGDDDDMVIYVSHMWLSYALYSKPNPATGRARNFPCDLMNTLFLVLHRQVIPSPSSSSLSISMTFLHYDIVLSKL